MPGKHISALVVSHSNTSALKTCLAAIASQSRPPDSVIVVLNGTRGDERAQALSLVSNIEGAELLEIEENSGAAGGFGAGISHLMREGVADAAWCFDDDATALPGCLEELEAVLDRDPTAGCVGALTQCDAELLSWPLYQVGAVKPLTTISEACTAASTLGTISTYALSWHALLIPKSTILRVGNVWTDLFHQYEDAEYGLRVRSAGLENLVAVNARCKHPASPNKTVKRLLGREIRVGENSDAKEYLSIRNSLLVRHRHDGLRFWYRSLPEILLRACLSTSQRSDSRARFFFDVVALGILDAVRGRTGAPPERLGSL